MDKMVSFFVQNKYYETAGKYGPFQSKGAKNTVQEYGARIARVTSDHIIDVGHVHDPQQAARGKNNMLFGSVIFLIAFGAALAGGQLVNKGGNFRIAGTVVTLASSVTMLSSVVFNIIPGTMSAFFQDELEQIKGIE